MLAILDQLDPSLPWKLALLTALSVGLCTAIVGLSHRFPRLTGKAGHLFAVQASHLRPTPRVGGIAILVSFAVCWSLAPPQVSEIFGKILLANSVLFLVSLREDLGFAVSPRRRLLAALAASMATILALGIWLPRADVPVLDALMPFWAVGIPLTLFATVGMANGFNLIDGVNGLAGVTGIAGAIALAVIADRAAEPALMQLSLMLAAGVLGFLLLNYPTGLIFLGDAGAYTLGFVLSWIGIAILVQAPAASPWAILLTLFWPVADTSLAIWRRSQRRADKMLPDRLHIHQLVMRSLEIHLLGRSRRHIANPLSTLFLAPFVSAPPLFGVLFWDQPMKALLSVLVLGALIFTSYTMAVPVLGRLHRGAGRPVVTKGDLADPTLPG